MDYREEWVRNKNDLVQAVSILGFPEDLGEQIAKQLGSPKAMRHMISYLYNVKPKSAELVVDEMLAIKSEIDRWREKKEFEIANSEYNMVLNNGLGEQDDEYDR